MTASDSRAKRHMIVIDLTDADDQVVWSWKWTIDDETRIGEFSKELGRNVGKSSSLKVPVYSEEEADAVATIIRGLSGKSNSRHQPPELLIGGPDYGFEILFSLSLALWRFHCAIIPDYMSFAEKVLRAYAPDLTGRRSRSQPPPDHPPAFWLFIALVFDWKTPFKDRFIEVVTKSRSFALASDSGTLPLKRLPKEFTDALQEARDEKVSRSWQFVKHSISRLPENEAQYNGGMAKIKSFLMEKALNPVEFEPDALASLTASELLEGFEESLKLEDEATQVPTQTEKEKIRAKDPKGSIFGAVVRHWVKDKRAHSKKPNDDHSIKTNGSNENSEWRNMIASVESQLLDFRSKNFNSGLSMNGNFSHLRHLHVWEEVVSERKAMINGSSSKGKQREVIDNTSSDIGSSSDIEGFHTHRTYDIWGRATIPANDSSTAGSAEGTQRELSIGGSSSSVPQDGRYPKGPSRWMGNRAT